MTRAKRIELALLTLLAALAAAWIPWSTGSLSWSWDALNHHVYLGLIAEHPRWDLDVVAASSQTYQYPYLYWPVYRLAVGAASGVWAGALWSGAQAVLLLPPVWAIADRVVQVEHPLEALAGRVVACVLAFTSTVVLVGIETTSNDLLAAVPLLWAVALGLRPPSSNRRAFAGAALWGIATAFKLSNGLYLAWLPMWWWTGGSEARTLRRAVALALGSVVGFSVAYAPWGWQLWNVTGNPMYPYFGFLFGQS